jgi:hypothetical protein
MTDLTVSVIKDTVFVRKDTVSLTDITVSESRFGTYRTGQRMKIGYVGQKMKSGKRNTEIARRPETRGKSTTDGHGC